MPTATRPGRRRRPRCAARCAASQASLVAGEVRVQAQAGELVHARLVAGRAQLARTAPRCAGPARRSPAAADAERLAVPEHDGLALVGDADRGRRRDALVLGLGQGAAHGCERRRPDLLRLVLDPAVGGEVLRELLVPARRHPAVVGDQQRGDARGAGVDREDGHRGHSAHCRAASAQLVQDHGVDPPADQPLLEVLDAGPGGERRVQRLRRVVDRRMAGRREQVAHLVGERAVEREPLRPGRCDRSTARAGRAAGPARAPGRGGRRPAGRPGRRCRRRTRPRA